MDIESTKEQLERKRKEVINLALQAKTSEEIEKQLYLSQSQVAKVLKELDDENSPQYNPELSSQIKINRRLEHHTFVDKDFLEEIIALVQNGFTFLEIACLFIDKTEKEIIETLQVLRYPKSPFYDNELYQRIMKKQQENISNYESRIFRKLEELEKEGITIKNIASKKAFEQFEKKKKIRAMIFDCITNPKIISNQDLAMKHNLSITTVSDVLNGKQYQNIVLSFIDEESFKSLKKAREIASPKKNRFEMDCRYASEEERLQLDKISKQMNLWIPIVISFGLTIDDLAILLKFPNTKKLYEVVYLKADYLSNFYTNALNYSFASNVSITDEERQIRRENATQFLNELTKAQITKNKEQEQRLLRWLTDYEAKKLIASKKIITNMTEEEKRVIIQYRIKYAIPWQYLPYSHETLYKYATTEEKEKLEEINHLNNQFAKEAFFNSNKNQNGAFKK